MILACPMEVFLETFLGYIIKIRAGIRESAEFQRNTRNVKKLTQNIELSDTGLRR